MNNTLKNLVDDGIINTFSIENKNLYGEVSDSDNYEELVIEFPYGKKIKIIGFCSGSLNNVTLSVEDCVD